MGTPAIVAGGHALVGLLIGVQVGGRPAEHLVLQAAALEGRCLEGPGSALHVSKVAPCKLEARLVRAVEIIRVNTRA
jgi:hypothetical protein